LSRNKERLTGAQQQDTNPPPQAMQAESSGFSFVVPTEFVDLPSQGKYYPEGHPLRGEDTIEIRQMTAKEEDMLTSRTLLKKGVALERVINSLIIDKRIDPDSLLVGDRNAIIIATRVSGYGNEYATKVTCPNCATVQEFSFDLNETSIYYGENIDKLEIVDNKNGTFDVDLPRLQVTVTFRLLTGKHERNLLTGIESDKRSKKVEQTVTRQLTNIVVGVNGNNTPEVNKALVENIPSMDSRHIRLAYRLAAPNVDLTQHFKCSECDYGQEMEVPLTADFFWPDR
tara:strand:- start:1796 stop:2650 length:855 start_codon:yes stop_codon:yes gene_type:complete